jgi:hypothetical protein
MSNKDYNDGLDTAASIVEEMLRGTSEGETILCGIENSKKTMIKQKTDNTPKLRCPWCIPSIDNCHCSQDEIQKYYKEIDEAESPYCEKCDSCGETGCCPPINCEAVKCKYGEINLKDYKCFQDQWEVMFNALKNIVSNPDQKSPDSDFYFSDKEYAQNALNEVDKLWDKLYSKE